VSLGQDHVLGLPQLIDSISSNIKVATKFGFPDILVANDPSAPVMACTRLDATIDMDGRRCSTFEAFLPEKLARSRQNLTICTGAIVTSLDIQFNDGNLQAIGAFFEADTATKNQSSTKYHVSALREIVLCCGAIVTPQVLMLRLATPLHQCNNINP
jgi:choline dehydrogenase